MRKPSLWPRQWHAWLAIALLLPFLLIAITGALFAHGNTLGLRQIRIPVTWLPAYQAAATPEIRSAVRTGETWWLASPQGLIRIEAGQALVVAAFAREDVLSLINSSQGLLVISAQGLWRQQQGKWTKILSGPLTQASADEQMLIVNARGKGTLTSQDNGATWQPLSTEVKTALSTLATIGTAGPELTVAQLVHDLHTGKALFTDKAAWLWQDFLALVLSFLALSGFYMWWTKRRARMAAARVK